MKLLKSRDFTKNEKKIIVYYTVSQIFLGILLIVLQVVFFYQMFSLFKKYANNERVCPNIVVQQPNE